MSPRGHGPSTGHHATITALVGGPNGILVSGDAAGWVLVWPSDISAPARVLRGPFLGPDPVYAPAWRRRAGRRRRGPSRGRAGNFARGVEGIVVVREHVIIAVDGAIEVFHLRCGRRIRRVRGVRGPLHVWAGRVWAVSPDGDRVLALEPATWRVVGGFALGPSDGAATRPEVAFEGGFVARADARHLLVASLTDGEVMDHVLARWQRVDALALAPGGERVALVADGQVRTITVGGREDRVLTVPNPSSHAPSMFDLERTTAAWDGDGVIVAGYGAVIRWDDVEGCVTTVLAGPASAWCEFALGRPDGTIACGCPESMVPGHTIDRPRTSAPALHLAFPEPGTVVAAYGDGTIRWWNTRTRSCERTIRVLGTPRALDPTGESVATEFGGSVAVYDTRSGAVIARSPVDRWSRAALVGGRLAISEGRGGRAGGGLRVLSGAGDVLFEHPRDHAGAVALDSGGRRVAWAESGDVHVRDLASGEHVVREVADLNGVAHALAFAPDGSWLACGGNNAVAVVRVADGACRTFPEISCCGGALAVSVDGRVARAQSHERWVWVLDPLRNEARALYGHRGHTTAVAWSPDGSTLASGGADGSVCLFDPVSGVRHAILGVLPDGTTAAW